MDSPSQGGLAPEHVGGSHAIARAPGIRNVFLPGACLSALPVRSIAIVIHRLLAHFLIALPLALSAAETPARETTPKTIGAPPEISPALREAIGKLEMPGVKINLDAWSVDVESRVCLKEGLLELIACTKDSKEHESVIVIDAKPSHVHTALLLLGSKPGNPAMQQAINPEMTRFRSTPPSGSPIDVFLVFKNPQGKQTQYPISDFLAPADRHDAPYGADEPDGSDEKEAFPTHTFLFAGSVLVGEGEGPRRYLCDLNGNVISISTFGDELLCLPGIHDHANGALAWQVNGDKLPELDSKVILRLRPQLKPQAARESGGNAPQGE